MEANYFKMLWWFFPYIDMDQPQVHMCPPILKPPPTSLPIPSFWVVTGTGFECLASCVERHFLFYWFVFIPLSKISWLYFCGLFLDVLLCFTDICIYSLIILLSYCSVIALKSGSVYPFFLFIKFSWLALFLCLSIYILELACCGLQKKILLYFIRTALNL